MSCAFKILSHIEATPLGQAICTREVLKYGSRSAVDKTMARLVKQNVLIRLARGVFMRMDAETKLPSVAELARIKNTAFGKTLVEYGGTLARKLGLIEAKSEQPTFYINGNSTSFMYLITGTRIILKSASKKRMQLQETPQGKIVRAVWHLGKERCTEKLVNKCLAQLPIPDISDVLALSKAWMPAWLADYFPTPHVFSSAVLSRDIFYDSNFAPASSA